VIQLPFDIAPLLDALGWAVSLVAGVLALYEYLKKKRIQQTLSRQKEVGFKENLSKGLAMLPDVPEFERNSVQKTIANKYLLEYIRATSLDDPAALVSVWEKISSDIGKSIESNAKHHSSAIKAGLSECVSFLFLSHYAKNRAQELIRNLLTKNNPLERNIARYHYALTNTSRSLNEFLNFYSSCSEAQVEEIITVLRGEEYKCISQLLVSEKWQRRMNELLRDYVSKRQLSFNSLVNDLLEANPLPKLFVLFKNEGAGGEQEEQEEGKLRLVSAKLKELRQNKKADMISPMASVHFLKDRATINDFLDTLPEDSDNNYVIFTGEIDPLSISIKTSDRLVGKPMKLYSNLQNFRDMKDIYEAIMIRFGIRPIEIIEKADIGFLFEPKTEQLSDALRKNSVNMLKDLGMFSGKEIRFLTELRNLDENDVGYLGKLISDNCHVSPSEGKKIAGQAVSEAKELHDALYGALDRAMPGVQAQ
jgi:hypothetical protein